MKKLSKVLLLLILLFGVILPASAVFEEQNMSQTLRVLKHELKHVYNRTSNAQQRMKASRQMQQKQMVQLMEDCNELSLMLYSQKQDFTFDLTHALEEVSKQYREFSNHRRPFVTIINQLNIEIERYQRLIYTLKRIPPALIEEGKDSLQKSDSTILLASKLQEELELLHEKNLKEGKVDTLETPDSLNAVAHHHHKKAEHDTLTGLQKSGKFFKNLATTVLTGKMSVKMPSGLDLGNNHEAEEEEEEEDDDDDDLVMDISSVDPALDTTASSDEYIFILKGAALKNRDSCIFYAEQLLNLYEDTKSAIVIDSVNYNATWQQLESAYNYAQERYKHVQKKIFIEGQTNYFKILFNPVGYFKRAKMDANDKWAPTTERHVHSQWSPQTIFGLILFVMFYLGLSILLSNFLVRRLMKRVKYFRNENFKKHGICLVLLFSVVIFAIIVTVAMLFTEQNFLEVATRRLIEYAWLLAAIFLSLAIRARGDMVIYCLRSYLPIMVLSMVLIFIRITFIPNSLIILILPPMFLIFTLWQSRVSTKYRNKMEFSDSMYNFISLAVMLAATVLSWSGYVLMSILVVIMWTFQLSVLQTVTAIENLLKKYHDRYMMKWKRAYALSHSYLINTKVKGSYIEVTWFYDFVKMAVIPAFSVWSIPLCVYMASNVFDLSTVCLNYLSYPFLNYDVISLSVNKILLALSLAFVFNYFCYLVKSLFRAYKIRSILEKTGQKSLPENMVNFTLSNSIISFATWGIYIITVFFLLKIPSKAISIVAAGLATGIGFALKDVINNFFYGVSLMSGRLRVGDIVECDGIRGVVDTITYQSTMIETEYGSVMAFPNAALYSKNFKNLTRNHAYELLILPVGIKYGSDVEKVRAILKKELMKLNKKDKYGRLVLDPKYGIVVRLSEFGDSAIIIKVYQQVLVEERYPYTALANETIYKALNANNIEIPFPQRDVYIKQVSDEK
ncbi:MAG: mechanosensitive ion channel family protein [Bacteroidales bacterium]|nr:mechanosensitive ion channel family protein [Bacteroidales bacterium]